MLDLDEVDQHPHNASRNSFVRKDNDVMPIPAPKLSITPGISRVNEPIATYGQHNSEALESIGYSQNEINELIKNGIIFAELKNKY